MTPTAPGAAAESWAARSPAGREHAPSPSGIDDAGFEVPGYGATTAWPQADQTRGSAPYRTDDPDWTDAGESYVTGVSGRGLVVLGGAAAGACTVVDLLLTGGRLTFFFDLCFVVLCLVSTMAVRRSDLFTAGVLPPLLYAGVIATLSVLAPHAFEAGPGVNKVFLTGLADHAAGLVSGYGVALATVAARVASTSARRT